MDSMKRLIYEKEIKIMNIILPVEPRQKFQVGNICKIVEKGKYSSEFEFPKQPLEPYLNNRFCIVLNTYAQVFWGTNFTDYSVYLLPRDKDEYCGSLAWIEENQLRYVRQSTEEEIRLVIKEDDRMLNNGSPYTSIFNDESQKFREENGIELFIEALMRDRHK